MPVITIRMAKGRSEEQKREIIKEFTESVSRIVGVDPERIIILIEEFDPGNIGRGGIPLSG